MKYMERMIDFFWSIWKN